MTIQFNSDKNLTIHESFNEKLGSRLSKELDRFTEHITRLEVHLSDENAEKKGINDKKCLIEARIKGKQPVAVTAYGNTHELAVNSAADKLKNSLDTIFGRLRSH